jgi:hydrogenase expression/formation protein HypC
MCLAVPGQISHITCGFAKVEFGGIQRKICLALVPHALPGDWVLVHAGFAIQVLSPADAQAQVELINAVLAANEFGDN